MKPDWDFIRTAYLHSNLSLRELATKHGVSFSTLGKRAVRERWLQERERLGNNLATRMETVALQTAEAKGRELGLTASRLIERSLSGAELILDKIETELRKPDIDAQALRSLVAGWRDAVLVGRQTHRLDDLPAREPVVRISHLQSITLVSTAKAPPPPLPAVDVEVETTEETTKQQE